MANLLATALDGSGIATPITPATVEAGADREQSTEDDEDPALTASRLGAPRYLVGRISEDAGGLRVRVLLRDLRVPGRPLAELEVEGAPDDIVELGDELAREVLCALVPPYRASLTRVAARAAGSIEAFKLFLRGEEEIHGGRFFAAAEWFQRAIEAEPDFGLAYYRLAMAALWAHNMGVTRRFATEAAARRDQLPDRERHLLEALDRYLNGDTFEAERLYRKLLEGAPGDVEAAFLLGTLLFFHNPLRGRPQNEARPWLERVVAIQPDHILALLYLSTLAARAGEMPTLESLTRRILELYPDGGAPGYPVVARAQAAFMGPDPDARPRALAELKAAGSLAAITATQVVTGPRADLSGPAQIIDLLIEDEDAPPGMNAAGHLLKGIVEWGRGRPEAARRAFRRGVDQGSFEARESLVLLALSPFAGIGEAELTTLRDEVSAWDVSDLPEAPPPIPHAAPHHGVHASIRTYLLGLIAARLGEIDSAFDAARQLEENGSASGDVALGTFALTIRAEALRRDGRAGEALRVLTDGELRTSLERALSSSIYSHGHPRFLRAELLRELGRPDEALPWYGTFGDYLFFDVGYLAPAQFRIAEIRRAEGPIEEARVHAGRAARIWADCEPVMRPFLTKAVELGG
jgi:tetratricopeptide (TPR) repeat protein